MCICLQVFHLSGSIVPPAAKRRAHTVLVRYTALIYWANTAGQGTLSNVSHQALQVCYMSHLLHSRTDLSHTSAAA